MLFAQLERSCRSSEMGLVGVVVASSSVCQASLRLSLAGSIRVRGSCVPDDRNGST